MLTILRCSIRWHLNCSSSYTRPNDGRLLRLFISLKLSRYHILVFGARTAFSHRCIYFCLSFSFYSCFFIVPTSFTVIMRRFVHRLQFHLQIVMTRTWACNVYMLIAMVFYAYHTFNVCVKCQCREIKWNKVSEKCVAANSQHRKCRLANGPITSFAA